MTDTRVFLDYTQEALDRAYDQRVWAPEAPAIIARWTADSASARDRYPHRAGLAYGATPDEVLDFFPAKQPNAPLQIFVHGGAWRSLTKNESAAAAPTFIEAGAAYAALNFSVIPAVRLPEMVSQVRRAVVWLWRHAGELGVDPNRLFLSGHSSGGHVAGVVLTTDWASHGGPPGLLKGGTCLSGMYELAPVMLSARSSYVILDEAEVAALSPMRHLEAINCPVIVGYGERESPEFIRQSREFAAALKTRGRLQAELLLPGLNHFEAPEELNRSSTALARLVLAQMGLAPA